MGPMLAKQ
jgi:hypothetical protein